MPVHIDAVHTEHLNQQLSIERVARDVIQVHTGRRVIVPDADPEILGTQSESAQRVDVFHHQVPQRGHIPILEGHPGDGALEHLQHERTGRRITVLTQRSHLIGFSIEGILIGHGQHLRVVQGLAQADEAQTIVVGELGLGQSTGIAYPLVMDSLIVDGRTIGIRVGGDGGSCPTESHDIRVARHVLENFVVRVVGRLVEVDPDVRAVRQVRNGQVGGHEVGVFTDIGECNDVPDVLCIGLRIDHINFNPGDPRSGIHHWQTLQGGIILVPEELGQEIVPVRLVIIRSDIELLGLGTALDLDFLALSLLLTEDRGVVDFAPLRLELRPEQ